MAHFVCAKHSNRNIGHAKNIVFRQFYLERGSIKKTYIYPQFVDKGEGITDVDKHKGEGVSFNVDNFCNIIIDCQKVVVGQTM